MVLTVALDLGKNLLEKGVEWVGGVALENLFQQSKPVDVRECIRDGVTSIEAQIAGLEAKIDQQNLDRMASELDSIHSSFAKYARFDPALRERNKNLLEYCDTTSAALLSLSMRYEQAFFLSTAVLAYRMLTGYALYQLDYSQGPTAQEQVTSLVSTGEMTNYFRWATQSRYRLVSSLVPQYAIQCSRHQEWSPFATPKTQCDILRKDAQVGQTDLMIWTGKSYDDIDQIYEGTNRNALGYVYRLQNYKSDRATWESVREKSAEQLLLGADCMERMYLKVSGQPCPPLLNRRPLESQFKLQGQRLMSCTREAGGSWRCGVPSPH